MAFKCACGNHKITIHNNKEIGKCNSCGSVFSNDEDGNILISKRNGNQMEEPQMYLKLGDDNKLICN